MGKRPDFVYKQFYVDDKTEESSQREINTGYVSTLVDKAGQYSSVQLGTQVLENDSNVIDFTIQTNLNARAIPGLRSRNTPIVPPSAKETLIGLKVRFSGKSGIAKLRTILADFQASFCHKLKFKQLQAMLDYNGPDRTKTLDVIASLNKFMDALGNKNLLNDIYGTDAEGTRPTPWKLHSVEIKDNSRDLARPPNIFADGSFVEYTYGEAIRKHGYIAGLKQFRDKTQADMQKALVSAYIEADRDGLTLIDFDVEIQKPLFGYGGVDDVILSVSDALKGPHKVRIIDIKSSKSNLTLAQYVILNMRANGHYATAINLGYDIGSQNDFSLVNLINKNAEYTNALLSIPSNSALLKFSNVALDEDNQATTKQHISDLLIKLNDTSTTSDNTIEELKKYIKDYVTETYNAYVAGSIQSIIDYDGIPVAIHSLSFTFNPNGLNEIVADFVLAVFNYKPFLDVFDIDNDLFVKYRDVSFIRNWISKTKDPIVGAKLTEFLTSVITSEKENRPLDESLLDYMLNPNQLEFVYKTLPDSISDMGTQLELEDPMYSVPSDSNAKITDDNKKLIDLFTTVVIPTRQDQTSIIEISFQKNFHIATLPIVGSRFPVYQYTGSGSTAIRLTLRTIDVSLVNELNSLQSHILNTYRQVDTSLIDQVVTVRNEVLNLFDVESVIPVNMNIKLDSDTGEYIVTVEMHTSEVNKDQEISLLQDSGNKLSGLEGLIQKSLEKPTRPLNTADWGVADAIGYAIKNATTNVVDYFSDTQFTSQQLRDSVSIRQKTTNTDVASMEFLQPIITWLYPLLDAYTTLKLSEKKSTAKKYDSLHGQYVSIIKEEVIAAKETLLQSPQTILVYETACFGLLDTQTKLEGFSYLSSRYSTAFNISRVIFLASKSKQPVPSTTQAFIKSLLSFCELLVLQPDIRTTLSDYDRFQMRSVGVTNSGNPIYVVSLAEHIKRPDLPKVYNPTEYKVTPNSIDVYPDMLLPTYKEIYANAILSQEAVSKLIWSDDNISTLFPELHIVFVNTTKLVLSNSDYLSLPIIASTIERLSLVYATPQSGEPTYPLFINNNGQIITSIYIPTSNTITTDMARTYGIAKVSLNHLFVNIYNVYAEKANDYSDRILSAYDNTSLINTLIFVYNNITGTNEQPINQTLDTILNNTEEVLNEKVKEYLPTFDYYGATPAPLADRTSVCKSAYDKVDPGFFFKSLKGITDDYDPKMLPLVNKDVLRDFINLVDTGNLPPSLKHLSSSWKSKAKLQPSKENIYESGNNVETEEYDPWLSGYKRNRASSKQAKTKDAVMGLRLETGANAQYIHESDINIANNNAVGGYDLDGKTRALFQFKDGIDHMSAYKRNIVRAYPTAMLWFVEEDTENMYAFDDMYQYTAITSISTFRHKTFCGKAIVTVSNITGALSRDRFSIVNNTVIDKLIHQAPNSEDAATLANSDLFENEFFQDKIKIMPGTKVIIKIGYGASEELLPKVFIGRISGIQGGPELTIDIDGIELELFKPYSGNWGKFSPLWICHDQLADKADFSRPIGLNSGLLESDVPIDQAGDFWYRAVGNKVVSNTGLIGMTGAASLGSWQIGGLLTGPIPITTTHNVISLGSVATKQLATEAASGLVDLAAAAGYEAVSAPILSTETLALAEITTGVSETVTSTTLLNVTLSGSVFWPLLIGAAVIGIGLYLASAAAERRKNFGLKDLDCTINVYKNTKPWAWGFNWLHYDMDWFNNGEETFYNLVKLARYQHNLVAGVRYLDNGGTFYMGPSQGYYIFTRNIPSSMLNLYKASLDSKAEITKAVLHTLPSASKIADYIVEKIKTDIKENKETYSLSIYIANEINKCIEKGSYSGYFDKEITETDIDSIVKDSIGFESKLYSSVAYDTKSEMLQVFTNPTHTEKKNQFTDLFPTPVYMGNTNSTIQTTHLYKGYTITYQYVGKSNISLIGNFVQCATVKGIGIHDPKTIQDVLFLNLGFLHRIVLNIVELAVWTYLKHEVKDVVDRMPHTKPFRKYHLIHSSTDIIHNGIYCSTEAMGNTVRIASSQHKLEKDYEGLFELPICSSIPPAHRLIVPIVDSRFTPGLYSTIKSALGAEATGAMMWAAMNHLAEVMKPMYRGSLTIVGNPHIEPHDIIYIADMHNNMTGKFEVESVTHHYSQETGFVTEITPHLLTTINDCVDWATNVWVSMGLSTAIIASALFAAVGGGVVATLAYIAGGAAMTVSKIAEMGLMPDFTGQGAFSEQLRNPVMFYPLQYKGVPYVAGVNGIEHVGMWEGITNKWQRAFIGAGMSLENVGLLARDLYQENVKMETNRQAQGRR